MQETTAGKTDTASTDADMFDPRTWRREKVWELRAKGYTLHEIVDEMKAGHSDVKISHGTVINDLKVKAQEIAESFKSYIEEELLHQHRLAVSGLDAIIKEAWKIYNSEDDSKTKLAALNVVSNAIMNKQAVLGDPEQIQKAIKVVSQLKSRLKKDDEEQEVVAQ